MINENIMESIGKQFDLQGKRVDHGLTAYGNKGSTDQHACVQQLREGVPNFIKPINQIQNRKDMTP